MANIRCPKCGEDYSDTYRGCPFCQEEEAIRRGKPLRRTGKRLDKKKRSSGAAGVLLVLAVVILCGVAGFMVFGDLLTDFMGIRTEQGDGETVGGDTQDQPGNGQGGDAVAPPAGEDDQQGTAEDPVPEQGDVGRTEPLSLSQTEMTIPAGSTGRLTAASGFGVVTWSSSNENIATVDGGAVTGKAGGTVTITATMGEETATCTVTVSGDPWVSDEVLTLNKTDYTTWAGEPDVQLKIKGNYSSVVWASSNPNVATVSDTGLVKRVGSGTATVTATADGHVLTCIVRCR